MRIYPFLSSFAFRLFLLLPFQIKKQQTTDDNRAADKGSHPRHLMQKQKTHQSGQQRRKEHKVRHLACFSAYARAFAQRIQPTALEMIARYSKARKCFGSPVTISRKPCIAEKQSHSAAPSMLKQVICAEV